MKKKVLAILMCLVLAAAMAMPAFADNAPHSRATAQLSPDFTAVICPKHAGAHALTVNSHGYTAGSNDPVIAWYDAGLYMQSWQAQLIPGSIYYRLMPTTNTSLSLNVLRTNNSVTVFPMSQNILSDYKLKLIPEGSDGAGDYYGIALIDYYWALTTTSEIYEPIFDTVYQHGYNLTWTGSNGLDNQLWYIYQK